MDHIAKLTDAEWQLIAPILPRCKAMRGRHDDRSVIDAIFFTLAARRSIEGVPSGYGVGSRSLRTRVSRWRADGTWPRLLDTGRSAIERMRDELDRDEPLAILARYWD